MPEISQAWLALIGAILGGSGLKFIEHWLSQSKVKDDSASKFRDELRNEVSSLREELRTTEKDLDEWKGKYYTLVEETMKVRSELEAALRDIADHDNKE